MERKRKKDVLNTDAIEIVQLTPDSCLQGLCNKF